MAGDALGIVGVFGERLRVGDQHEIIVACWRMTRSRWLLRIPMEAGHPFRREAGQRSDLMSATIPR
ncbi:hypothetical protein [Methylorubrum sp. SB2]|uniref:hypothetical protein n=1 Tax=Methylorubrum subtropicum TaxID=3138812 RepID=UPI00313E346E